MLAVLASGYHGPPELTVARAFTSWTLDPWTLAGVVLLAAVYLTGMRRVRRTGSTWPAGRAVAFCGLGLGFAVIATMSFVGVYQPVLFYVRSVQTILFLLVVPLFLALGKPLTLVIAAWPRPGQRIEAAIKTRTAKVVTFPLITTFVLVVTPFLIYFTPWYETGFSSTFVAQLTHLALTVPGLAFFWTLLRVDPVPKAYPYVVSLWITAAEVVGDAVLGLAVLASTTLIAGHYYHQLGRPWGPSLATDQVLGGGVLWILGDIVGLPFLAAQLIQMIREDEAEAKVIDAELDAQAALATSATSAAAKPLTAAGTSSNAGPDQPRDAGADSAADSPDDLAAAPERPADTAGQPWWETDRRFVDRFRAVDDPD